MNKLVSLWMRAFRLSCLAAGPCLCVLAAAFALHTKIFMDRAQPATGTVLRLEQKEAEDHSITYAPAFQFASNEGKQHLVTSNTSSNPPSFAVGQHVPVLYAPNNPEDAKIATFGQLWFFPITLAVVGLVAFGAGILLSRLRWTGGNQVTAGTLPRDGSTARLFSDVTR